MKLCLSGIHQCVVTTCQSMVLFFWKKLINLVRPSVETTLQHRTDGWEAGKKGKWYFPWALICSSNQNNIRWITTFFIFSLDLALLSKRYLGSQQSFKEVSGESFGLFYEALPSKSLHFRGKRCSGGKLSELRLIEITASNALGEKIPMFVTGKYASPRCFKHVRNLTCRYRSQRKAWMDGTLFEEWLHELDRKFEMQGRKSIKSSWKLSIYRFSCQIPLPIHSRWIRG